MKIKDGGGDQRKRLKAVEQSTEITSGLDAFEDSDSMADSNSNSVHARVKRISDSSTVKREASNDEPSFSNIVNDTIF